MMPRPDILIYSKDEKPQLIVEIKKKPDPSIEWATQTRRNLLIHGMVQPTPFFLLVTPNRMYLWKSGVSSEAILPDYDIAAHDILAKYIEQSSLDLNTISEYSLEMIVISFLSDLIHGNSMEKVEGMNLAWLYESGLYEAIRHGLVMTEAV
jgi:hypothetical protein